MQAGWMREGTEELHELLQLGQAFHHRRIWQWQSGEIVSLKDSVHVQHAFDTCTFHSDRRSNGIASDGSWFVTEVSVAKASC